MEDKRREAVDRFTACHHALIPHAEARRLGFTGKEIRGMVASGRWVPVGRGLSRIAGAPVTWPQRVHAACLLAGPGAAASHGTAGVLWELSGLRPGHPEITLPYDRSARTPASALARVHRSRVLTGAAVGVVDGIPVTNPYRTLLDLAADRSGRALRAALDDALLRRLVDPDRLGDWLARVGAGRPGITALRQALAPWTPGPMPGSVAEMEVIRVLVAHGVPIPERQVEVRDGDRLVARVDHGWPPWQVALETDSWRWHGGPQRFHRDHGRVLALRALGWDVLVATPECLDDGGGRLADAVKAALRRARRARRARDAVA